MQIEVGKSYRTRNGLKVTVTNEISDPSTIFSHIISWVDSHNRTEQSAVKSNGSYYSVGESPLDIIEPWIEDSNGNIPYDFSKALTNTTEQPNIALGPESKAIRDDGTKRTFSTGYQRDTGKDKGRWDLLSQAYYGLLRVAQLFARGAEKYGAANWIKGAPLSVYADCCLRHATKAAAGWEDEDHWSAVAWNALCLMQTQEMIKQGKLPKELDDLPKYEVPK